MTQTEKICTGCGLSSLNPISEQHIACCPDNNYVEMSNYKQSSIEWLRSLYENRPAYEEFITDEEWEQAKAMHKEEMTEFAKWIAQSEWMSIWVVDKWMWECQLENSNTTYITEEELYQIYLNKKGGNK